MQPPPHVLYSYGYERCGRERAPRPRGGTSISKVCEFCGKHAVAGHSISHSHRVVNRTFKPNIQRVTVVVDGHRRKANVCSRCLKSGKIARS